MAERAGCSIARCSGVVVRELESTPAGHPVVRVAGLQIPVISREAMVANKRAVGRAKDLLDLELLGEGDSRRTE